jgi:hypothetical protein
MSKNQQQKNLSKKQELYTVTSTITAKLNIKETKLRYV